MAKFLNPFTDYGFKKLFGEEPNKDLLLDFLNELLREQEGEITEISYLPMENLPPYHGERKAIFDLYCTNERGEKFIVELQKTEQKYFKDRMLYYATFPIQEQATRGKHWDYKLKNVYAIAILDFIFDHDEHEPDKYRYDIKLSDIATHKVFYDKLMFVYLELPKFNKTEEALVSRFDKWLYVLKNLNRLERMPSSLQDKIFSKLFDKAELANLSPQEFKEYQASLNVYRDIKNSVDTAHAKGKAEGRIEGKAEGRIEGKAEGKIEGKIEVATKLLKAGVDIAVIKQTTGLSAAEIKDLN
jgi:predicted transposase/invertase (TIGR01784 family)